ncbi:MAG: UbiA prenyltransferase family protein [Patescibacteria group bacterium]|nr:UbiA prenyltransferase family protein [Patescibacteria group bacterium]
MKDIVLLYARTLRVNQWIKNLVVFTAILFSGNLLVPNLFLNSLYAFFIFCLLSSTSYLLNDVLDYQYDKKHPVKRNRPIASGLISIPQATFLVFVLSLVSLLLALLFSVQLFVVAFAFILLHFFYSLFLKKYPIIDIFTISFSFMIRTFAGEVVSGFHIPIWLFLTIFFISLFMATVKRHAELVRQGKETRLALLNYSDHLLLFMTNTFATATILVYSLYTYLEQPPLIQTPLSQFYPRFEGRKWLMVTIPFVVYGIARYAQLLYQREEGERPEKIITTDKPLILSILLWGIIAISLIYLF